MDVAQAEFDEDTGYYSYALPDEPGLPRQTILISPADAPGVNGPTTLTGPVPLPEQVVNTGDYDGEGDVPNVNIIPSPWPLDVDFKDIILIFPQDSGLKPIYVIFRDSRNTPGTASGHGEPVGDDWLWGAGEGEGVPVPQQVADKLRGRTYSSTDAFRRALWRSVSQVPELRDQFKRQNQGNVDAGYSPFVHKPDRAGGRKRYELHHKTPISKGGALYDVDNISIMTPKQHIEHHKQGK